MNTRIIFDADSVLLNYEKAFLEFHGYEYDPNHEYNSLSERINCTDDETYTLVVEFNSSNEFGYIEPYDGVRETLDELHQLGIPMEIITSSSTNLKSTRHRIDNLYTVFGNIFEHIDVIPLRTSKEPYLARHANQNYIWVEDNVNNYHLGSKLGYHSVLFRSGFNAGVDNELNIINNWDEMNQYLKREVLKS